ncbi:hypothetical protein C8Q79DRAFT_503984 [Trametes meyenii]|nr:hypothetical protein C8Q79DRAFT_503984 [Trametes meyenii]
MTLMTTLNTKPPVMGSRDRSLTSMARYHLSGMVGRHVSELNRDQRPCSSNRWWYMDDSANSKGGSDREAYSGTTLCTVRGSGCNSSPSMLRRSRVRYRRLTRAARAASLQESQGSWIKFRTRLLSRYVCHMAVSKRSKTACGALGRGRTRLQEHIWEPGWICAELRAQVGEPQSHVSPEQYKITKCCGKFVSMTLMMRKSRRAAVTGHPRCWFPQLRAKLVNKTSIAETMNRCLTILPNTCRSKREKVRKGKEGQVMKLPIASC